MSKRLRILYAIQGTGNGHVARARDIIPILQKFGDLDIVLSGDQSEVALPLVPKFRSKGLTFIYNSKGAVSMLRTLIKNNPIKIFRELQAFPVGDYDLVINDFEFITAWACKLKGKKSFGLGHQAAFHSKIVPRPAKESWLGELILKNYAPVSKSVAFHFQAYDSFIFPPVIRREIKSAKISFENHYTVYLPAYSDAQIIKVLSQVSDTSWQLFSKKAQHASRQANVHVFPINNEGFIASLASSSGILTSAGFETPAEAMFLGKKLAVIPIKNQYEQFCNAEALKYYGVPVFNHLNQGLLSDLRSWVAGPLPKRQIFVDNTEAIIREHIIDGYLD